jgi:hypothetical protein
LRLVEEQEAAMTQSESTEFSLLDDEEMKESP